MEETVIRPTSLSGTISVPGDKSISHRSLLLNSMSTGAAQLSGLSFGEDVRSSINCLQQLGTVIKTCISNKTATITGVKRSGFRVPSKPLYAGNSGTTLRLLTGILAAQPFSSTITGDASLSSRPVKRIITPLTQMGGKITGRDNDSFPPLTIHGTNLSGIEYTMPVPSAQVKSCILLAGLLADGPTTIYQPVASRDHTERMLLAMGANISVSGNTIKLEPGPLKPVNTIVPGDISSAAFWIVAGCIHQNSRLKLSNVGINPTRSGLLKILTDMGANISIEPLSNQGGEPVAHITVSSSDLHGTDVSGDIVPSLIDEIPILSVAACFAIGPTTFRDASELRFKESDRIATTVSELRKLGAKIDEHSDGMTIHGVGSLDGGYCEGRNDHRLAMSLGIAGLASKDPVTVSGSEITSISYPSFWKELNKISTEHNV